MVFCSPVGLMLLVHLPKAGSVEGWYMLNLQYLQGAGRVILHEYGIPWKFIEQDSYWGYKNGVSERARIQNGIHELFRSYYLTYSSF